MPGSDPERRAQQLLEQFQKQEVVNNSKDILQTFSQPLFIRKQIISLDCFGICYAVISLGVQWGWCVERKSGL